MSEIRNIFDISARALSAQMTRMNTVASNLANANSVAAEPEDAFRALRPVFKAQYADEVARTGVATVDVDQVVALDREPAQSYRPNHPSANEEGYVFQAAVNVDEEMVEMLDASRQYQNNLEVVTTLRALMARTVRMGQ